MAEATTQPWHADRRLSHLLEVWQQQYPGPGRLPPRLAIDPIALGPELLPYVALIEAVDGGRRFRFRLVGSRLAQNAGLDLTGRHVDEVNPNRSYAAYIAELYTQSMSARRPVYSETRYRSGSGRIGLTRRLICPLSSDGEQIDMFVAAQVFEADNGLGDTPTYTFAEGFEPGATLVLPAV